MTSAWPAISYDQWGATGDTLHAHAQVLGKLAVELAPLEPTPDRPVADVTKQVLAAVTRLGGHVRINPVPQEVPWGVPPYRGRSTPVNA